ncbi:MAG: hypothetical protein H0U76_07980 [Ktedonobacteraceae bacterium]|nr:hypothetical protein [Ktedonobacteraceae bacterium]
MGIYLGQLPPAEIARLKAELAETLIANFCYPRFFDHRTESLQMRPVDRKKRQEVWLYLSSVDFTVWNRVDLTTPEFQHQIERLFIQFVQRNRSFFGHQGRRRMSDIRMLISSCAVTVAQGLRNHLTGQKQNVPPFGTPRPVVSWGTLSISGKVEPGWEQISTSTMLLQQQMQEIRGEAKTAPVSEPRSAPVATVVGSTNGSARRPVRPQPAASTGQKVHGDLEAIARQQTAATHPVNPQTPVNPSISTKADPVANPLPAASFVSPAATPATTRRLPHEVSEEQTVLLNGKRQAETREQSAASRQMSPGGRQSGPLEQSNDSRQISAGSRNAEALKLPIEAQTASTPPVSALQSAATTVPLKNPGGNGGKGSVSSSSFADTSPSAVVSSSSALHARSISQTASGQKNGALTSGSVAGSLDMLSVGEDDIAIFEQMRHQLIIWLRVEAIKAGLEFSDQVPAQLLEMLRQQAHFDETRLQVVSTLLNLANQVIKTGTVSVLDYKQALMFHLMHTRI